MECRPDGWGETSNDQGWGAREDEFKTRWVRAGGPGQARVEQEMIQI